MKMISSHATNMMTINKIWAEAYLCNFSNTVSVALIQDWTNLNIDCNNGNWHQPLHRCRITSVEAWLTDYEHYDIVLTFL